MSNNNKEIIKPNNNTTTTTNIMDQPITTNTNSSSSNKLLSNKKSSLSSSSRSFKLRSESLNSLRLRRVFDTFDKNSDDVITVHEIKQALLLLGLEDDNNNNNDDDNNSNNNEDDELSSIVNSFIKPGNKGLTFEDFEALHSSLSVTLFYDCNSNNNNNNNLDDDEGDLHNYDDDDDQVESDLNEAFKVFDSDGDGYISAMELQQVLSKLGFPEAQQGIQQIQHMISSVDENRDGRVDFFEFKHMMSRTLLVPC